MTAPAGQSPADLLTAAAAKLRETAAHATGGTWAVPDDSPHMVVSDAVRPWGTPVIVDGGTPEDADWIALMHPGVAEPLAAWLDSRAEALDELPTVADDMARLKGSSIWHALAVARALLGAAVIAVPRVLRALRRRDPYARPETPEAAMQAAVIAGLQTQTGDTHDAAFAARVCADLARHAPDRPGHTGYGQGDAAWESAEAAVLAELAALTATVGPAEAARLMTWRR